MSLGSNQTQGSASFTNALADGELIPKSSAGASVGFA